MQTNFGFHIILIILVAQYFFGLMLEWSNAAVFYRLLGAKVLANFYFVDA
jgi:hypothetical protein